MSSIPLPKSIKTVSSDGAHAVFAVEPLYPGYGITIGNVLRRVLLSSMNGAAITSVRIVDANHEFSTLPYVKEDVVDIILNLKLLRLKLHSDEPVTLSLKAHGKKVVTAKDIERHADVEIFNPDQVIATLTDAAAKLEIDLVAGRGRGYVPVEQRDKENHEIGFVAIDAIYTPVKNVNFTTEHVRVEQITNYDRLVLDITTDGTITPQAALTQAASIMVEHFQYIVTSLAAEPVVSDAPADLTAESADKDLTDEDAKPKKKAKKKAVEE